MEKKERYNKPYLLQDNGNVPYSGYLEYDYAARKTNDSIFWDAHRLPYTPDNLHLKGREQDPSEYDLLFDTGITEEKLLTYGSLPNRSPAPVVHKDVLALLLDFCPDDFQYFPIVIRGIHKNIPYYESHDYVLLNLLYEIDGIDMDKTIFSYDEDGTISWVERNLHLKNTECMVGHHIGRLKMYKIEIIVSPAFRALFKKHKVKGATFLKDREAYP